MNVQEISIKDIKVVENSRISMTRIDELMQDIKQRGLRYPIEVVKTKTHDYVIMSGNRRLVACKKLGFKTIPAIVCEDMALSELLIHNSAENMQRVDISPMELGRIVNRLMKDFEEPMTISEIASRISIPMSRLKTALENFNGLPAKHRNKVAYIGGGSLRNGKIPASVAAHVISVKRQHGLSDSAVEKLLNTIKVEEYGMAELNVIGSFLDQGLSVTQAIEKSKGFRRQRFDCVVNLEEVDQLLAKYKLDSTLSLMQAIMYGECKPLTRPDFVKVRQIPAGKD